MTRSRTDGVAAEPILLNEVSTIMLRTLLFGVVLFVSAGCAKTIPNTDVRDTAFNREILEFMERYRAAVNERDIGRILSLCSPLYLDDMGTPDGGDDLDIRGLAEKLAVWESRVNDIRYDIRYRRVTYEQDKVYVEYTYRASFELKDADADRGKWTRRIGDHRAVLVRNEADDDWAFLSGL